MRERYKGRENGCGGKGLTIEEPLPQSQCFVCNKCLAFWDLVNNVGV